MIALLYAVIIKIGECCVTRMIICFLVSEIIIWCQHHVDNGGQGENGGSVLTLKILTGTNTRVIFKEYG